MERASPACGVGGMELPGTVRMIRARSRDGASENGPHCRGFAGGPCRFVASLERAGDKAGRLLYLQSLAKFGPDCNQILRKK